MHTALLPLVKCWWLTKNVHSTACQVASATFWLRSLSGETPKLSSLASTSDETGTISSETLSILTPQQSHFDPPIDMSCARPKAPKYDYFSSYVYRLLSGFHNLDVDQVTTYIVTIHASILFSNGSHLAVPVIKHPDGLGSVARSSSMA